MAVRRRLHDFCLFLAWVLIVGILIHLHPWEMPVDLPVDLPVVYFITPTYHRTTQKADLTRLANTLGHVPNLHWIVVEDADVRSTMVELVLLKSKVHYTHMNIPTPAFCKKRCVARGTEQRNLALDWLRRNRGPVDSGVVYFGDDDNTYDLELFKEIRYTKRVSVFPVAFVGSRLYGRPIVRDGEVIDWFTGFPGRKFNIDMAGFAVNLHLLLAKPEARFILKGAKGGMQETNFLSLLTEVEDLEPLANNCTKVLVWHTRTEKPSLRHHIKDIIYIEV